MKTNRQDCRSQLFLVRLRAENTEETRLQEGKRWSGRVQRVVSGETYDFSGWAELISCLGAMLDEPQAAIEISE